MWGLHTPVSAVGGPRCLPWGGRWTGREGAGGGALGARPDPVHGVGARGRGRPRRQSPVGPGVVASDGTRGETSYVADDRSQPLRRPPGVRVSRGGRRVQWKRRPAACVARETTEVRGVVSEVAHA